MMPPRDNTPIAGRIGEPIPRPWMPPPTGAMPPAAPPGLSAAPDVWSLLAALRQRWIAAMLLTMMLGSIAAAAAWFSLTPKSTAFARLKVSYLQPAYATGPVHQVVDFRTYIKTQADTIKSRNVIWEAVKGDTGRKLNLLAKRDSEAVVQGIEEDLSIEFKDGSEFLNILYNNPDAGVAVALTNAIVDAYIKQYAEVETRRKINKLGDLERSVDDIRGTIDGIHKSIKEVTKKLDPNFDPKEWRDRKHEDFVKLQTALTRQAETQTNLILAKADLKMFEASVEGAQIRAARGRDNESGTESPAKAVDRSEPELVLPKFRAPAKLNVNDLVEQAIERDGAIRQYRSQLATFEKEVKYYAGLGFEKTQISYKKALEGSARIRGLIRSEALAIEDRVRRSVKTQYDRMYQEAKEDYDEKVARLRADHKARIQNSRNASNGYQPTSRPGQLNLNLLTQPEIIAQRERHKTIIDQYEKRDKLLAKEIEVLTERSTRSGPGLDYEEYQADLTLKQLTLANLNKKVEEEKLDQKAALRVTKYQDAELMRKDTKKQMLATMAAPFAVLCGVCGALAMLEHLKRKVRKASEISRGLGIRVVGAVPKMPNLERHLVGPGGESDLEGTPVMESIDAIRTRLLHEADVRSTRVVMVTSATAGEGKTTLAAALASSLARAGRKTLLLDGDLRRPTVHELFEVAMQPGFSEVLLGEIEVAEAAIESPQENLYLLPAGQWDREVLIALSRDGLEAVIEKLSEEFDFIVIDSHPVLAATDSLLIGRHANAVVLSVLREVSRMPRVYAAHQQLTTIGIRVLGAVVNGADPEEVFTTPGVAAVA